MSVTVDGKDGCGSASPGPGLHLDGQGDDEITTDGNSLVTVMDGKKAESE